MLIALATVSVAISSPVCQLLIPLNEIILIKLYLSVYLDVQAYDFFQMAGSHLHGHNVDRIAISASIRSSTRQTFNHEIKGKRKGE